MNSIPFGLSSMAEGSTAVLPGMSSTIAGSMAPGPSSSLTAPLSMPAAAQTQTQYGHQHSHQHAHQHAHQHPHPHSHPHPPVVPSDQPSSSSSSNSPTRSSSSSYTTTTTNSNSNSHSSTAAPGHTAKSSPGDAPTVASSDNQSPTGLPITAVPTACLGCRAKHLKCDGQSPCERCRTHEINCIFIASRRGYKGPRKGTKRLRSSSPSPSSTLSVNVNLGGAPGTVAPPPPPESCPMLLGAPRTTFPTPVSLAVATTTAHPSSSSASATMGMSTADMATSMSLTTANFTTANTLGSLPAGPITFSAGGHHHMGTTAPNPTLCAVPSVAASHLHLYKNPYNNSASFLNGSNISGMNNGSMAVAIAQPPVISLADRCFDAFYHYFFASHPFALPKDVLLSLAKDSSENLAHLIAAMRYVGSLYIDAGPARAMFFDEAMRLAYLPTCPKNGFLVQTLIMLIVGLDGSCDQERARQLLADVEQIAVDIGLHQRDFATAHGRGNPIIEESWRRTWWDLFVVDGMVAGVHRMTNFLLFDVPANVALPCEEHQYLAGNIPTPAYIEDFDDQLFTGDERPFSSFAYRIAAARILGRFMRCPPMLFPNDENLEKIESMLSNWRMHLPPGKRDDLTKHCQLDEMMFQAHFINHACTILLHQPHSQLDSSPTRSVTSCAPHRHVPSGDNFNTHTRHTITAACEISKMITQAVPLVSHTHFFTCVITLSSIVHLSKWALYYIQDEEDLRQQIRLNIGALQKLSEVWKAANTASGQVKSVAREIYQAKKAQQINPTFWVGFTQEEMISSINNDEGIMNDFDTILPTSTQ